MSDDPYAALGLTKSASTDEIKKAYRKIARTDHPDLKPGDAAAEARFKAASSAYDLLKDPEKRKRYDAGEIDASGAERSQRQYYRDYAGAADNPYRSGPRFEEGVDPADIFAEFMRQNARAGRAGGGQRGFDRGFGGGFDEGPGGGFGQGFGQGFGSGYDAPGADMRYALEVPFMDAALGGKTRITMPDGRGLEVSIPKGTADGQTIRLRGKGAPGMGKGKPGDALITISVAPHPTFTREGNDILVTLPITIDEAVLGGKVEVPTIDGPVKLNIPKGASSGQTLRMRGRGVAPAKGAKGDQRVELRIVAPPEVDEELSKFMEQWREKHAYDPRKDRGMRA